MLFVSVLLKIYEILSFVLYLHLVVNSLAILCTTQIHTTWFKYSPEMKVLASYSCKEGAHCVEPLVKLAARAQVFSLAIFVNYLTSVTFSLNEPRSTNAFK